MGRLAVLLHPDSFDVTSSASSASTACGASASMCSSYHEAWMARRVSAQVAMVMVGIPVQWEHEGVSRWEPGDLKCPPDSNLLQSL